jgi:tRNA threonylcarbamoyladenosine biosynthesis protein TsaE
LIDAIEIISRGPEDTAKLAQIVARVVQPGDLFLLQGDLGAGKTTFTRELAAALRSHEPVTSPTFVLQKLHKLNAIAGMLLVHYDAYRIQNYAELADLGFEEMLENNVSVVEWGDKFSSHYPGKPLRIAFKHAGEDSRIIEIELDRSRSQKLRSALQSEGLCP